MITLLSVLFLGFFLGMRHATDADHVVAVTNFITRQRSMRGAVAIGSLWGFGHSLAIMIVGGAIVTCGLVIPPRVGLSFEFCVAVMLIVIGLMNLESFMRWMRDHVGREAAANPGVHEWLEQRAERWPGILRPLAVGMIHGLAGSAALAILVVPMIQDARWAMGYLLMFGIGSIAGMAAITAAIAWPCATLAWKSSVFSRRLCAVAGSFSIAFGLFLAYQIGFVKGLFF
jgi:High-affinity nickel-transport protein